MISRQYRSIAFWAFFATGVPAAADVDQDVYQTKTIVTGERGETRNPGLIICFMDALVKVSGDRRLLTDPRAAALAKDAGRFVTQYRYHDRMAGKPLKDEQGTRDRLYDLTVDFDHARLDAALRSMGRNPWPAPRPKIVVFLAVKNTARTYVLAGDNELGSLQRESFGDAAAKYGIPVLFAPGSALQEADLRLESLVSANKGKLQVIAELSGGDVPMTGSLIWSREALDWIAEWNLSHDGHDYRWQISGVNFDAAFREAVSGAAQILSGNGQPL